MAKKARTSGSGMGMGTWLGVGAIVAVLGAGLYFGQTDKPPGQKMPDQGNAHIQSLDEQIPPYNSNPPTSGHHTQFRPYFDIYNEMLPNQVQVHALEDGAVIIHYHPEKANSADVEALKAYVQQTYPGRNPQVPQDKLSNVIVQPNSTIDTAWALTAWTRIDKFDQYDLDRINRFVRAFKGIDHHR